jgi:hypothetical protein
LIGALEFRATVLGIVPTNLPVVAVLAGGCVVGRLAADAVSDAVTCASAIVSGRTISVLTTMSDDGGVGGDATVDGDGTVAGTRAGPAAANPLRSSISAGDMAIDGVS